MTNDPKQKEPEPKPVNTGDIFGRDEQMFTRQAAQRAEDEKIQVYKQKGAMVS